MITIDSYTFGNMTIRGELYKKDLIISNGNVLPEWRRKEGHKLCLEDLEEKIEKDTDILVIGTGAYGVMNVPKSLREELEQKNITVHIAGTPKAVQLFNQYSAQNRDVSGAFHLTC